MLQKPYALALQLHFPSDMGVSSGGLVRPSPAGPGDDVGGLDAALSESDSDAADLLD